MKEFKFRLESVLNIKEQEEKAIQKELAKLQNKYHKVERELDNQKSEKKRWQSEIEESEKEIINLDFALKSRNYIKYLNGQIEELLLELKHWEEKINDCRQRLLAKSKEKKTLVKLKEKQYEQYWQEFLKEEQQFNDELATIAFNHKENKF